VIRFPPRRGSDEIVIRITPDDDPEIRNVIP